MKLSKQTITLDHLKSVVDNYGVDTGSESGKVLAAFKDSLVLIEEGNTLINIHDTVASAGLNSQNIPSIAMCHYSSDHCRYTTSSIGHVFETNQHDRYIHRLIVPSNKFEVTKKTKRITEEGWWYSARPVVPNNIAELLRPDDLICWEVDIWKGAEEANIVRPDSVALRRISSLIYIVLAEWNPTPLEIELFGLLDGGLK